MNTSWDFLPFIGATVVTWQYLLCLTRPQSSPIFLARARLDFPHSIALPQLRKLLAIEFVAKMNSREK